MGKYSGAELLTREFWKRYPNIFDEPAAIKWIEHLAARDLADDTIRTYARDLELFLRFCAQRGVAPTAARIDVVDQFFLRVKRQKRRVRGNVVSIKAKPDHNKPLKQSTVHLRSTVLTVWFDYLRLLGLRDDNPLHLRGPWKYRGKDVRPPRKYQRRPEDGGTIWIPNEAQVYALWSHLTYHCDERDRFMMRLSYDCGLRVSELVDVNIEDFDFTNFMLTVRGKGDKTRLVPFRESLVPAFERYIEWRRQIRTGRGPLFVSTSNHNYGERVKAGTWNVRVEHIREAIGLPKLVTHTMRHLICTDLARMGMDIVFIANFAGHRNLRTTQIYINLSGRDLQKALSKSIQDLRDRRASMITQIEVSK